MSFVLDRLKNDENYQATTIANSLLDLGANSIKQDVMVANQGFMQFWMRQNQSNIGPEKIAEKLGIYGVELFQGYGLKAQYLLTAYPDVVKSYRVPAIVCKDPRTMSVAENEQYQEEMRKIQRIAQAGDTILLSPEGAVVFNEDGTLVINLQ